MNKLQRVTSDFPRRSAFEISQVPPVEAESTPAVPRACSAIFLRIALKSSRAENLGILTMAPARRPVPMLEGQVKMYPNVSECITPYPSPSNDSWTALVAFAKRVK